MAAADASRRLSWWFAGTAAILTASLALLAWTIVKLDRDEQARRRQDAPEQAADAAVAGLGRLIANLDDQLAAGIAPGQPGNAAYSLVVYQRAGAFARSGLSLPFYPAVITSTLPAAAEDRFAAADRLELAQQELMGALSLVRPLTQSSDRSVRAGVWLRMGRNARARHDWPAALDAFSKLSAFGDVILDGAAAGLSAAVGRLFVLSDSGDANALHREALQLRGDLQTGRWMLTPPQYANALHQAAAWLGEPDGAPLDSEMGALAIASEAAWRGWLANPSGPARIVRRAVWTGDRSVLTLSRAEPERLTVLLIGPRTLGQLWAAVSPPLAVPTVSIRLTDDDEHAVLGQAPTDGSSQAIRLKSSSGLPWTVHAVDTQSTGTPDLTGRTRFMLSIIAVMTALVLVGGYVVHRSAMRESQVARLQSEFVAAVSHEFRTPLTTVRQLSELLARDRVTSDERRQQFYETMLAESDRLHRLVENLLDFGRMEAGRFAYRFSLLDLPPLVEAIAADLRDRVSRMGYQIVVHSDPALPSVRGDAEALGHVVRNLLDNAVKYSPDDRTVSVRLARDDHGVAIRVQDRGVGIPEQEQGEIFQRFFRGASAQGTRGTGIGLAMARQVVQAHGGSISVESAPGQGSTFTVVLPIDPAPVGGAA